MKFKDIENLLEANLEIGNGKNIALSDRWNPHYSLDRTGSRGEMQKVAKDATIGLSRNEKTMYAKVLKYLKQIGKYDKIAKLNYNTPDLQAKGDGSVVVNFDNGGSMRIDAKTVDKLMGY